MVLFLYMAFVRLLRRYRTGVAAAAITVAVATGIVWTGLPAGQTLTPAPSVVELRVYSANFITGAAAVEQGVGGSTHRSWYLHMQAPSANDYLYHTHNDGSTGGGVDTGYDPGLYEAALAGSTGHVVAMAAGYVTAEARAALLAAEIGGLPWCHSAVVAGADNADGSRTITITGDFTSINVGDRDWDDRGAAGPWGSHAFRRALTGEIAGAGDTTMTRNICSAITTPPATARIHAVSMVLGATVSTTAANIPRFYLRSGSASTTIPGATMSYDFGQLPVSAVLPGRRATLYLTPTQSEDVRTALDAATNQLWLCTKAAATTQNNSLPTGGSWNGELSDLNIRVDTVTSGDGSTAAPSSWNNAGVLNFAVVLSASMHYEVDPASNGESYPIIGSLRDLSTAANEVTLPNTVTRQVNSRAGGHRGAHLHSVSAQLTDTGPRYAVKIGGDLTTDPDDPSLTGATTLYDFGQAGSTGTITFVAPTGDSSVILSSEVITIEFKGNGLRGWGWTALPAANTPLHANDYIYANGAIGSADGTNQHELDYAGENGDQTTAFLTPVAGVATQPNNLPALRMTTRRQADTVTAL